MESDYKNIRRQAWLVFLWGLAVTSWTLFVVIKAMQGTKSELKNDHPKAETKIPESKFTSDNIHKAMCGLELDSCTVKFDDGKLKIGKGLAIKRSQFRGVVKSSECRQRFILFPVILGCLQSQYDKDFTVAYTTKNGLVKSTQISFRPGYFADQSRWKRFQVDLHIWTGDVLKPSAK